MNLNLLDNTVERKEVIKKISEEFEKLKKRKHYGVISEQRLIRDITGLTALYRLKKAKRLEDLIENMILFGERKDWAMQGCREAFEYAKES
ncbi:hypothetical protein GF336_04405 [Candidatus Woesearchaeota archaeon]|nr:hypothetical protein [Candidatus Woesearchaeota archaeon]